MQILKHKVLSYENTYSILNKYNLTLNMLINSNARRYPSLISDPFRIYYGWELNIPIVVSGNNTQYDLLGGE